MRKLLTNYKTILLALFIPFLFVLAYILGQPEPEEATDEPVADYTAIEPPVEKAQPVPKSEELTLPSQNDKVEAQEVAAAFVMAFHAIDAEQPFQYLEDAKPYMTDSAFENHKDVPKRGTLATQKLKPTATDMLPVELSENVQVWRVGVTSETETKELVFTEYLIQLVKEGQQWKVDGVDIND